MKYDLSNNIDLEVPSRLKLTIKFKINFFFMYQEHKIIRTCYFNV